MQYAFAAAKRGERAIVYAFDEVLRIAMWHAESLGMSIKTEIDRGTLRMAQVDPAELSPGEFIWQIRRDVEEHETRVVVTGGRQAIPLRARWHLQRIASRSPRSHRKYHDR
jgi:circadian clock protein KaiC